MAQDDKKQAKGADRDWRETLFLPETDFPMKAGLPRREPELLERWEMLHLYERMRADAKGREKYILHDGPPYANGHLHIGHALNKILKDIITRSHQMMGWDAIYVPGWDCHGLPIEWKIEEKYRQKKKNKDEVPINEFRKECRDFAAHWVDIQRGEFERLGVEGDWDHPYLTMNFDAEATIADELMKFAMNGSLYQGSKPVMWSVVERTALAEAEVEYEEKQSPTIWVKFPVRIQAGEGNTLPGLVGANVVIWTTTPWTIPGNRAIAFSPNIKYALYEVTEAADDNWAKKGEKLILAEALAETVREAARIDEWVRVADVDPQNISVCDHPLHESGYDFEVRLYEADFVTDDTGTGFVHIAPGHGQDDYGLYENNRASFEAAGIPDVPYTVEADGHYAKDVPLFGGDEPARVMDDKGKWGNANEAVIQALMDADMLIARGRLKHDYPHSWRSKAPVIFRNTPQWFIALDKPIDMPGKNKPQGIRETALGAIGETRWVPPQGENRITAMIENRPDWVVSRQRAWGVPLTIFVNRQSGEFIPNAGFDGSDELVARITRAFREEGADAWFDDGARSRFLSGLVDDPEDWDQVLDILDVWFDSGSTHAFVLEQREELQSPASVYLEGSDQHRGWFQSSLLESCGTRGRAPYETVVTHGFLLDEKGEEKVSKSKGNALSPESVSKQNGAEILRLWVASSDYWTDVRFGPAILKANTDAYRKMRNTIRFMLGNLHHFDEELRVDHGDMPELERYVLHRLQGLDELVRDAYEKFDFKRLFAALFNFTNVELSAFYFDIRKDALYCDAHDSLRRRATLTVLDELFSCLTAWLAPVMCFTMEEAWLERYPSDDGSVHLRQFPDLPDSWHDGALFEKWEKIRRVRKVVTGALEVERREKRIGSSLDACPKIYVDDAELMDAVREVEFADIVITSGVRLIAEAPPEGSFMLDDVAQVGVVPDLAQGRKCQRSWKVLNDVGSDPDFPDLSPRDADAVRQFDARKIAAQ